MHMRLAPEWPPWDIPISDGHGADAQPRGSKNPKLQRWPTGRHREGNNPAPPFPGTRVGETERPEYIGQAALGSCSSAVARPGLACRQSRSDRRWAFCVINLPPLSLNGPENIGQGRD
jgi:hypothetical protein